LVNPSFHDCNNFNFNLNKMKREKREKILSLFDGISIAQQAFKELGYEVEYYASEIDKNAIQITQKNHPNTEQLGDIKDIDCTGGKLHYGKGKLAETDIYFLIGGSPCQDLSIAKKNREGLDGKRSGLFWEYVRILKELKPRYFILENVASMSKEAKQTITDTLWGIEPVMINAALVSAQNRKRLFWIGKLVGDKYERVEIPQPEDRGILLKDILLPETYTEFDKSFAFTASYNGAVLRNSIDKSQRTMVWTKPIKVGHFNSGGQGQRVYSIDGKSVSLTAMGGGWGAKTGLYLIKDYARKLEPIECERLQSLPDNYTEGLSKTARYKALGNGFNCSVIKHILENILCLTN
jgi:DNA (cytosine-5)-methyltransferase 3A